MSEQEGFIIDTPQGIEMFRVLQVLHGLAMEINTGMSVSSRGSIMLLAREMCGTSKRTKKGVLRDYVKWVQSWHPTFEASDRVKKAMAK